MFTRHPDRNKPFASAYLEHRAKVTWFDQEFKKLINKKNPHLDIETLVVTTDFAESPFLQFAQQLKTSNQIYDQVWSTI